MTLALATRKARAFVYAVSRFAIAYGMGRANGLGRWRAASKAWRVW